MVNKIAVNPLGVRGAGNIVSPKTLSDFNEFNSDVISGEEYVNGTTMTVYTVSYWNGAYFTITSDDVVPYGASSFVVSATLKREDNDSAIDNATVTCTVNDDTVLTGTTNSSGVVSFTVDTDDTVKSYIVKLQFGGLSGQGGGFKVTRVLVIDLENINIALTGDKSIIQSGESLVLSATLTGEYDGNIVPLRNKLVEFFIEE
jgi:hypothetical protein